MILTQATDEQLEGSGLMTQEEDECYHAEGEEEEVLDEDGLAESEADDGDREEEEGVEEAGQDESQSVETLAQIKKEDTDAEAGNMLLIDRLHAAVLQILMQLQ